ncbi:fluoride efflux transporter FluC [Kitasatospora sp. NPDC092286]|uniref:fluoride efflux transporter FluC n=1 Tax=Kitasatospora sp. NPDC092286 TaxID=3364087 RepID=UPI0037F6B31F
MLLTPDLRRHGHPDHSPAGRGATLAAVALGGALGAAARYGAGRLWPVPPGAFPWTTLVVNVVGCALMGALMVTTKERFPRAPALLGPMIGTGVLGGFTTFSTYINQTRLLLDRGDGTVAAGYLVLTAVAAPAGVWLGVLVARLAFGISVRAGEAG